MFDLDHQNSYPAQQLQHMKQAEKQRLIKLTREAIEQISDVQCEIKIRASKVAQKFSPTNAEKCRELSEIVWWLIAASALDEARRLLDALCEIDDEYYWMFHAQAGSFATRAYLHAKLKNPKESKNDSKAALAWVKRDPNFNSITKSEVTGAIKRFDDWIDRADNENGTITALHVLSHALRVLVMYQQFAKAGNTAARSIPSRDFTNRINSGLARIQKLLATLNSG